MGWIEKLFTRLEADLKLLIEGSAASDGFPGKQHRVLVRELAEAMRNGVRPLPDNAAHKTFKLSAPEQYTLVLPTVDAQLLLNHPTELDRLTRALESLAEQGQLTFSIPPVLRVVADPCTSMVTVLAEFCQPGMEDSSTFQMENSPCVPGVSSNGKLPNAFLIVNGVRTYLITAPVINIGSDVSNQLQLNDPQISHQHAQLRLVHGRFVIFDLDSLGRTSVNGVSISSHILNPGDVIQLAGIPLVYGQDLDRPTSQTQELPANPPPPEVL